MQSNLWRASSDHIGPVGARCIDDDYDVLNWIESFSLLLGHCLKASRQERNAAASYVAAIKVGVCG